LIIIIYLYRSSYHYLSIIDLYADMRAKQVSERRGINDRDISDDPVLNQSFNSITYSSLGNVEAFCNFRIGHASISP